MKRAPAPPRASEGVPLRDPALEVSSEESEVSEEPESEDGALTPLFTSNLMSVISLPVWSYTFWGMVVEETETNLPEGASGRPFLM